MKKMLALLATSILVAQMATAQTAPAPLPNAGRLSQERLSRTPEQRADLQASNLTRQLGLSADQTPKVRAVALAQVQEMQVLREKYTAAGSRQGMGPELKAVQEKYDAQLKEILTADQYASYTRLREDRADKVRQRRAN